MTYSILPFMLSVLLPLCLAFPYCNEGPCQKGQFLEHDPDSTPVCQPCPPDTYMDQDSHMCGDCFHCMEVKEYHHEITLEECTPESNRVVVCKEGYFRVPGGGPTIAGFCEKCKRCADDEIISKECDLHHDTVCSPYPRTQKTLIDESRATTENANNLKVKKTKTPAKFNSWDVQLETALERLPLTIFLTTSPFVVVFSVKLVPIFFNKLLTKLGRQEEEEEEVEGKEEEEEKKESME